MVSAADHVARVPRQEARAHLGDRGYVRREHDHALRGAWTGPASEELCAVLTPPVRDFEAGKLRFKRSVRHGDEANHWEMA